AEVSEMTDLGDHRNQRPYVGKPRQAAQAAQAARAATIVVGVRHARAKPECAEAQRSRNRARGCDSLEICCLHRYASCCSSGVLTLVPNPRLIRRPSKNQCNADGSRLPQAWPGLNLLSHVRGRNVTDGGQLVGSPVAVLLSLVLAIGGIGAIVRGLWALRGCR